jgi:hypothetical protein
MLAEPAMKPWQHEQAIDGLLHARGAQRVAGERLGGRERRNGVAKHFAHGAQLGHVAHGGGGAVGVDVVDGLVSGGDGLAHAGNGAVARRGHHVGAIGRGTKTDNLGQDGGATRQGVFQAFEHHGTAAAAITKPSRLAS